MAELSDVHGALLRLICRAADHVPGVVVDAGTICREHGLKLNPPRFSAAVVALTDATFLEYVGAGPRVRVTEVGAVRCAELDPPPSLEALKAPD